MRRPCGRGSNNVAGAFLRPAAKALLPLMLPLACRWVESQERRILAEGKPLDPAQLADARALDIAHPERVRLLALPRLPLPHNALIRRLGLWTGTLSQETVGLSARYGVFLRTPFDRDRRLLAHELTHTRQYERLGGVRPFLRRYLHECLTDGYPAAAMEREAADAAEALCA